MPYVTALQMQVIFEQKDLIEVTNLRNPAATNINTTKLQAACDGATGVIDGYLMLAYAIPLVDPTVQLLETLKLHGANIARYILDASGEDVQQKYEAAIAWLQLFVNAGLGAGDTTPGVDTSEKFGSLAYEITPSYWSRGVGELF